MPTTIFLANKQVSKPLIKIGTRDSKLALWQAKLVQHLLETNGYKTELVLIKSEGDINLTTPLYEMGVQGIFTKTLDAALLDGKIDIAVHSYKDVPTKLAAGLHIAAVLKRGNPQDLLVINKERVLTKAELKFAGEETVFGKKGEVNGELSMINNLQETITVELLQELFSGKQTNQPINQLTNQLLTTIATSSTRRKAQILNRFPNTQIDNLRGNVNSRIKKVTESNWHGAIFAAAGIERLGISNLLTVSLHWMLPAPAQGAISVVSKSTNDPVTIACATLNHAPTQICTQIEKDFLRVLKGGCTTPIGAYAVIKNDDIIFKGNVLSADGKQKIEVELISTIQDAHNIGSKAAQQIMAQGGQKIIDAYSSLPQAEE